MRQFYTSRRGWRHRNIVKRAGLSGCNRVSALLAGCMNEMNVQQSSDLPIEIYFASLDARSEKGTLTHIKNVPDQPQTIRMQQASDTDTVAHFHLLHRSLFRGQNCKASQPKNYPFVPAE